MRFLVDACVPRQVADWLRAAGHDVLVSVALGPDPGDHILLEYAEQDRRVLLTMDKDFGVLVYRDRLGHAGLVRLPHVGPAQCVVLMRDVVERYGDALDRGAVVTVQERRVRVSNPEGD